jgi:hypothetical protein
VGLTLTHDRHADTALLGNFYAYPTFREKYGKQLPDGT